MKVFVEHQNKWTTLNCDASIKSVQQLAQAALSQLRPDIDNNIPKVRKQFIKFVKMKMCYESVSQIIIFIVNNTIKKYIQSIYGKHIPINHF